MDKDKGKYRKIGKRLEKISVEIFKIGKIDKNMSIGKKWTNMKVNSGKIHKIESEFKD